MCYIIKTIAGTDDIFTKKKDEGNVLIPYYGNRLKIFIIQIFTSPQIPPI